MGRFPRRAGFWLPLGVLGLKPARRRVPPKSYDGRALNARPCASFAPAVGVTRTERGTMTTANAYERITRSIAAQLERGVRPWTQIFDHYFFDSCYSMSPGGRMEICTTGPGFQLDEKLEDLGDRLCLSPRVEPLRAKLESELTPIINPRPRSKKKGSSAPPAPATNGVPATEPATIS